MRLCGASDYFRTPAAIVVRCFFSASRNWRRRTPTLTFSSAGCDMQGHDVSNSLQGLLAKSDVKLASYGGIETILKAVRTHLGMDVAFVAEFRARDRARSRARN